MPSFLSLAVKMSEARTRVLKAHIDATPRSVALYLPLPFVSTAADMKLQGNPLPSLVVLGARYQADRLELGALQHDAQPVLIETCAVDTQPVHQIRVNDISVDLDHPVVA
jgi:hypothetical protein